MLSTWLVVFLAVDAVAFISARILHRADPERAFDAVSIFALVAGGALAGGHGLSIVLDGARWATYPGYAISAFVAFVMLLKTHRPILRALSGGRLAKIVRFAPVATIEQRHRVTIGPRLRAFLEGEWRTVDGRVVLELPSYQSDTGLALRFGDSAILEMAKDWDVDWSALAGWLPLAELVDHTGEVEAQFLVVRAEAPHAVGMWEHETGEVEEAAESLDEFLEGCAPAPKIPRAEAK